MIADDAKKFLIAHDHWRDRKRQQEAADAAVRVAREEYERWEGTLAAYVNEKKRSAFVTIGDRLLRILWDGNGKDGLPRCVVHVDTLEQ